MRNENNINNDNKNFREAVKSSKYRLLYNFDEEENKNKEPLNKIQSNNSNIQTKINDGN